VLLDQTGTQCSQTHSSPRLPLTAASAAAILLQMFERIPKSVLVGVVLVAVFLALYAAYTRPWYFTDYTYLGGILFLEILAVAIWMYRRVFFGFVLLSFLLAGLNLPVGRGWAAARWPVLGVGAFVGVLMVLKHRGYHFGFFHLAAFFAVLAGLISASVSLNPDVARLKVLSLLLLFVYAATGARVAVPARETKFFHALLTGCEIFVGANAAFYALGIEAMGNPNSLGAVMGMGAPILLWGALLGGNAYRRRLLLYGICIFLAFVSHARAGIGAAFVSSAVLCLAMHRYKLMIQGTTLLIIALAAVSLFNSGFIASLTSSVVYKNNSYGILDSRVSPWQSAIDNIRDHPWFGMGLGTTAASGGPEQEQGTFVSSGVVTAENGSSYLSIVAGVGILGTIPFAALLLLLISKIVRTVLFVHKSGAIASPAFVLAGVMIAGILHAIFEDWMFAPGNYLCVFYWSLAFIFIDVAPQGRLLGQTVPWTSTPGHRLSPTAPAM